MTNTTKWLAGMNTVLGLWLLVVPFLFAAPTGALYSALTVDSLLALVGGYNYYLTTKWKEVSSSGAALNALLGLYVVAAPFLFGVPTWIVWNGVLVGGFVAMMAGYNAYVAQKADSSRAAQAA